MRLVCEQYLEKGPKVLYHLAVQETSGDDAGFVLTNRWDNPKFCDSETFAYPTEIAAKEAFSNKIRELMGRGYRLCARPLALRSPASQKPVPPPSAEALAHLGVADETNLSAILAERRQRATWAIE